MSKKYKLVVGAPQPWRGPSSPCAQCGNMIGEGSNYKLVTLSPGCAVLRVHTGCSEALKESVAQAATAVE